MPLIKLNSSLLSIIAISIKGRKRDKSTLTTSGSRGTFGGHLSSENDKTVLNVDHTLIMAIHQMLCLIIIIIKLTVCYAP